MGGGMTKERWFSDDIEAGGHRFDIRE